MPKPSRFTNSVTDNRQNKYELKEAKHSLVKPTFHPGQLTTMGTLLLLWGYLTPRVIAEDVQPAQQRRAVGSSTSDMSENHNKTMLHTPEEASYDLHSDSSYKASVFSENYNGKHTAEKKQSTQKNTKNLSRYNYVSDLNSPVITDALILEKIKNSLNSRDKELLQKAIKIARTRSAEDAENLDFILKHPTFYFSIENINAAGRSVSSHIKISPNLLKDPANLDDAVRTVIHEGHHFAYALRNLNYESPSKFDSNKNIYWESTNPFYTDCDKKENAARRQALKDAIQQGDDFIIKKLHVLRAKFKDFTNRESVPKKDRKKWNEWEEYKSAAEEYIPAYHSSVNIGPTDYAMVKTIAEQAISQGRTFPHTISYNGEEVTFYVDKMQPLSNGGAQISGYAVADVNDKMSGLIADTKVRTMTLHDTYSVKDKRVDDLREHDAMIQEHPKKIRDVYYKDRKKFHDEEKHKAELRLQSLPFDGEEVTSTEVRCRA